MSWDRVRVVGITTRGVMVDLVKEVAERDKYQWFVRDEIIYIVNRERFVRYEVSDLDWLVSLGVVVGYSCVAMVDGDGGFWKIGQGMGGYGARATVVQEETVQRPQKRRESSPVVTAKFDAGPVSRPFLSLRSV